MKYITIPKTVTLTSGEGATLVEKDLPFLDWIESVLYDQKLGKTAKDILMIVELKDSLRGLDVGGVWAIDTAHSARVSEVVEEPSGNYIPVLAVQLVSYLKAVLEPEDDKPSDDKPTVKKKPAKKKK